MLEVFFLHVYWLKHSPVWIYLNNFWHKIQLFSKSAFHSLKNILTVKRHALSAFKADHLIARSNFIVWKFLFPVFLSCIFNLSTDLMNIRRWWYNTINHIINNSIRFLCFNLHQCWNMFKWYSFSVSDHYNSISRCWDIHSELLKSKRKKRELVAVFLWDVLKMSFDWLPNPLTLSS